MLSTQGKQVRNLKTLEFEYQKLSKAMHHEKETAESCIRALRRGHERPQEYQVLSRYRYLLSRAGYALKWKKKGTFKS